MARGNEGRRGTPASPSNDFVPQENFQRVYITLSPEINTRLEHYCHDEERAKSWVIRKALEEWLTREGY